MVMNGRQGQKRLFGALGEMTQPTHCHLQPARPGQISAFLTFLSEFQLVLGFSGGGSFRGQPASGGQEGCLHTGALKIYNGEGTGKARQGMGLATSLQVGLRTFQIRNNIKVYQCLMIRKVYLFLRHFEWQLAACNSDKQ